MDNVYRLLQIMQTLRDPEKGCPWDQQQTFESIVPHTIEEVYEVVDAIDRRDYSELQDELGDLLFQVVYYAQLGREQNIFDFDQIARGVADKLVRRHPHVFGESNDYSIAEVAHNWEHIKQTERAKKNTSNKPVSLLDDIPKAFPQLVRAHKLQKRAATVGFDWDNSAEVLKKVEEELKEVKAVHDDQQRFEEEIGDLLFSIVNLCRHKKVRAEEALRQANNKFEKRFRYIEGELDRINKKLSDCNLDELDDLWEQAKQKEVSR